MYNGAGGFAAGPGVVDVNRKRFVPEFIAIQKAGG
jgi:hypothetical protein